jgi:hypothetical protein
LKLFIQAFNIIDISKIARFEPQPSLEDSATLRLVFTSLDFVTNLFLQSKAVSLTSNPQPGGLRTCMYAPQ